MNQSTLEEINLFSKITLSMQLSFDKTVNEWSPEIPPLTILFAELGSSFIENFDLIENQERVKVFEAIEDMLTGENNDLNVGASTGFLEAILEKPSFSKTAKSMLGKNSRSFLRAWLEFLGIEDKDL